MSTTTTLTKQISSADGFHHLVYSISGTTHTVFLDGSSVSINTNGGNISSIFPTISNLFFGTAGDLSYGYTGYIDDVKIYNRALTVTDVSAIYNANVASTNGVFNNISAAGKTAMLKTTTTLQAGGLGLVKLNSLYTGPTIQIKAGTGGTPTDFYAQSATTYGTLQTVGGVSLITFLGGQTAYVTKWYDQTGNGNHASNIGNPTYDTTNNTVLFASNYFSLPNNAFPTGNSPYSYLFTPNNQTTTGNAVFQGGDLNYNIWVHGILNYNYGGTNAIYQNGWYANTSYYARNLGGGFSNGVKIANCYDGTNGATGMMLYYNNIAQTFTGGNNATRNQTAGNNYIGHSDYTGEGIVNYTGSFKYFFWAPVVLSLPDIIILNSV